MIIQFRAPRTALRMAGATLLRLALAFGFVAGPAIAQEFELPAGFIARHEPELSQSGEWRALLTVRPEPGPFSELSAIHLREVNESVKDPVAWLKRRLTLELGDTAGAGDVLNSPDSPFSDPFFDALRKAIPELMKFVESVAELPLGACDDPGKGYNASGSFDELYCVFVVGPLRQYRVLRLQNVDGRWFYTDIETMNERRLRHLMAIADTFKLKR